MPNTYAITLVESLVKQGITDFCIAPGSRSTPLTLAVAAHPSALSHTHFDERGLGFYALGLAKVWQKPVAIIVTSGTAVANLFPAVIEAHYSHIPLLILSADRPVELLDTGANQAIDQTHFFGRYVRWFFSLHAEVQAPEVVHSTASQAIQACMGIPKGPVHLNVAFRDPLFPTQTINSSVEGTVTVLPRLTLSEQDVAMLAQHMHNQKGILIVGELHTKQERQAIAALANHLKWPVFADITATISSAFVVEYLEEFIQQPLDHTLIVQLGGRLNSSKLLHWISTQKTPYIQIKAHLLREDPLHQVTCRVSCDTAWVCHQLIEKVPSKKWKNCQINRPIDPALHQLSEAFVADFFKENISTDTPVFCSNSLPIRRLNTFGRRAQDPFLVLANRGASGIDGIIASAIGAAQALQRRTLLWIGDLSALHDLNSLALLSRLKHPMLILVSNNNGGGIFETLPVVSSPHFNTYFKTPHGFTFEYAALQFNVAYTKVDSIKAFEEAFRLSSQRQAHHLIELYCH